MTGAEWLAGDSPLSMLSDLQEGDAWTPRKARLFAVTCCRRVWSFLPDETHRDAEEVSARFADDVWWEREGEAAMAAERAVQVSLIRDIFGNPFHPAALAPACVKPTTISLGQAV